jgi:hypothetical protein
MPGRLHGLQARDERRFALERVRGRGLATCRCSRRSRLGRGCVAEAGDDEGLKISPLNAPDLMRHLEPAQRPSAESVAHGFQAHPELVCDFIDSQKVKAVRALL